MKLASVLTQ